MARSSSTPSASEVGQPIQAADPLSSGSSRLKAGRRQDCLPHNVRQFFPSRRELPITERLESTMAAAARMGLSTPAMASVMPTAL
jgi:hypothetical protein